MKENNVLIGSKFFQSHEQETKPWEFKMLQKLSQEVMFIPTILDYHFKGSAVEFAYENIGSMYPVEFEIQDLKQNPTKENIKKFLAIKSNILHSWKHQITYFGLKNDCNIRVKDFLNGSVVVPNGKMYFLNIVDSTVRSSSDNDLLMTLRDSRDGVNDMEMFRERTMEMYLAFGAKEIIKEQYELRDKDRRFVSKQKDRIIREKDTKLKNSINKDIIKAQLGLEKYKFYFGDSDG